MRRPAMTMKTTQTERLSRERPMLEGWMSFSCVGKHLTFTYEGPLDAEESPGRKRERAARKQPGSRS